MLTGYYSWLRRVCRRVLSVARTCRAAAVHTPAPAGSFGLGCVPAEDTTEWGVGVPKYVPVWWGTRFKRPSGTPFKGDLMLFPFKGILMLFRDNTKSIS